MSLALLLGYLGVVLSFLCHHEIVDILSHAFESAPGFSPHLVPSVLWTFTDVVVMEVLLDFHKLIVTQSGKDFSVNSDIALTGQSGRQSV